MMKIKIFDSNSEIWNKKFYSFNEKSYNQSYEYGNFLKNQIGTALDYTLRKITKYYLLHKYFLENILEYISYGYQEDLLEIFMNLKNID